MEIQIYEFETNALRSEGDVKKAGLLGKVSNRVELNQLVNNYQGKGYLMYMREGKPLSGGYNEALELLPDAPARHSTHRPG